MDYKGLDKNQLLQLVDDLNVKIKLVEIEKQQMNKKLVPFTTGDLTGLCSHGELFEVLKEYANKYNQTQNSFCVIMFDIDDFKRINELKGHLYGDMVLQEYASIFVNNIKDSDIAGRYSGEEFMVILADTKLSEAFVVAERIRKAVEEHFVAEGIQITVSGGVEEFNQGDKISDILLSLDLKLYVAKKQGKNRIIS